MQNISIEDVFKYHPELRHLISVSCPNVCENKIGLGGILFVCPNLSVRKSFVSVMRKNLSGVDIKEFALDMGTRAGDIGAHVTSLAPGGVFLCDQDEIKMNSDVRGLLGKAISENVLDIVIGSGPSAKAMRLDLAESTYLLVCDKESDTTRQLAKHCKHVVILDDHDLRKICEVYIVALLNERGKQYNNIVIKKIVQRNDYAIDACIRSVNRLCEYVERYEPADQNITDKIYEFVEGEYALSCDLGVNKELNQIKAMVQKIANERQSSEAVEEQLELIIDILEEIRERLN